MVDSWVLDAGAELGTEDTFNEGEGVIDDGLLLELPIGEDPGKVEADETAEELLDQWSTGYQTGRRLIYEPRAFGRNTNGNSRHCNRT